MISGDGPARRGSNLYTVLAANRGVCSLQRGVREHPVKDASHAALMEQNYSNVVWILYRFTISHHSCI
jgi:hypothetical protein